MVNHYSGKIFILQGMLYGLKEVHVILVFEEILVIWYEDLKFQTGRYIRYHARIQRGGQGVRTPPGIRKFYLKKGNFRIFWGLDPPSSVTKNYHFRWTPSHENFWIRAWVFRETFEDLSIIRRYHMYMCRILSR